MIDQIKIAVKMYDCNVTARKFFKDEYSAKIKWYKDVITAENSRSKTDTLKSVLNLCSMEAIKENGMAVMMFMSAAVDLIENKK